MITARHTTTILVINDVDHPVSEAHIDSAWAHDPRAHNNDRKIVEARSGMFPPASDGNHLDFREFVRAHSISVEEGTSILARIYVAEESCGVHPVRTEHYGDVRFLITRTLQIRDPHFNPDDRMIVVVPREVADKLRTCERMDDSSHDSLQLIFPHSKITRV